jgi:hypothetical protein
MNEEITSINLYDIGNPDAPNVKDMGMVIQDAYPTTLLMDDDSEDLDADGIENSDDAF